MQPAPWDAPITPRAIRQRIDRIDIDMSRVPAVTSEVARLLAAFRMWTAAGTCCGPRLLPIMPFGIPTVATAKPLNA